MITDLPERVDVEARLDQPLLPLNPQERRTLDEVIERYESLPIMSWWRATEMILLRRVDYEWPVLDLGCGDGSMAEMVFGRERKLTLGLDLSEKDTGRARARGTYENVQVADLRAQLPAEDASFATIFSNSVFEHIPGVEVLFPEIRRVLRPGGRIVFTVPSEHLNSMLCWPRRIARWFGAGAAKRWQRAWDRSVAHVNLGGEPYWRGLLEDAGLEVITMRPMLSPTIVGAYESWQVAHNLGLGRWNLGTAVRAAIEACRRLGWPWPARALSARVARDLEHAMADEPARPGANLLIVARRPEAS